MEGGDGREETEETNARKEEHFHHSISMILVKLCVDENIPVIPIPGPSAFVAALSASGLAADEFTFVGFLPKHVGSRKERLIVFAKEVATQIFYVPPHKLHQFIEKASSIFGDCSSKRSQLPREMTKIHEENEVISAIDPKKVEILQRFLDRLVSTLEEKKHHQVKLKEGLKDLSAKRMELQDSLTSLWPKQVPGIIGCHQALEAIKIASDVGEPLSRRMLLFDALTAQIHIVKIRGRSSQCEVCAENATFTEKQFQEFDYEKFTQSPLSMML
ncbi:unnamed protein product [Camellia sinensis]